MSDRQDCKGTDRINLPKNTGCLRRGESGSVVSCVRYDAMHQGATAGFGHNQPISRLNWPLNTRCSTAARYSCAAVRFSTHFAQATLCVEVFPPLPNRFEQVEKRRIVTDLRECIAGASEIGVVDGSTLDGNPQPAYRLNSQVSECEHFSEQSGETSVPLANASIPGVSSDKASCWLPAAIMPMNDSSREEWYPSVARQPLHQMDNLAVSTVQRESPSYANMEIDVFGSIVGSDPVMLRDSKFRFQANLKTGEVSGDVFLLNHLAGPELPARCTWSEPVRMRMESTFRYTGNCTFGSTNCLIDREVGGSAGGGPSLPESVRLFG